METGYPITITTQPGERENGAGIYSYRPAHVTINYPVTIQRINRAYPRNERIPWDRGGYVAATCRTLNGLLRRLSEERAAVSHDHGQAWSGHVRAVDALGNIVSMATLQAITDRQES